jgi:hypothetical protein
VDDVNLENSEGVDATASVGAANEHCKLGFTKLETNYDRVQSLWRKARARKWSVSGRRRGKAEGCQYVNKTHGRQISQRHGASTSKIGDQNDNIWLTTLMI